MYVYVYKLCIFSINNSVLIWIYIILFVRNQEIDKDKNDVTSTLLELLRRSEETNKKLLQENKELVRINQQLYKQVEELQTNPTQNSIIQEMKKIHKRKPMILP